MPWTQIEYVRYGDHGAGAGHALGTISSTFVVILTISELFMDEAASFTFVMTGISSTFVGSGDGVGQASRKKGSERGH